MCGVRARSAAEDKVRSEYTGTPPLDFWVKRFVFRYLYLGPLAATR